MLDDTLAYVKALVAEYKTAVASLRLDLPEEINQDNWQSFAKTLGERQREKFDAVEAVIKKVQDIPIPTPKPPREPLDPEAGMTLGPDGTTPKYVVEKMLRMADLREGDILYDLGSGEGRIVEMAADLYRIQAGGVEINPVLVELARQRAIYRGLKSYVDYMNVDAETVPLARATVVTLNLSPEGNLKLRTRLREELLPGARILSTAHDMGNWKPDIIDKAQDELKNWHTIYLWRIPQRA